MTTDVVTDLSLLHFRPSLQGKVRDIFDLGKTLLVVATDRLSAFDVVLPDAIPDKGKVLTQISAFWFRRLAHVVPHHLLSTDTAALPAPFAASPEIFAGRSMLVKKARPLPVECVVRGYLSGSGWNEYKRSGSVCGMPLPAGLRESDRLREPIFTPSTKAEKGAHDENISFDDVVRIVGGPVAESLREMSVRLYREGEAYAETRGIIIADTKFEFGMEVEGDRGLVWIDEALTPDSSRFWAADDYRPGGPQASFDKQFVRDYLLSLGWDKSPPAPRLPTGVITTTSEKYKEALRLLTGQGVE